MLEFQELTVNEGARLRPYYEMCDYRLCEYSLGVKLMWRGYLHPWFAEAAGCLIIRNCIEGEYVFDYPITGPEGDEEAALAAIEAYCGEKELPLVLSVVPEDKAARLVLRYPRVKVISERPWKDYLYRTEELAQFAGRRYSGQRNHINKFRRDYPDAEFVTLNDPKDPRLAAFWADYEAEFHKSGPLAKEELALAQEMFGLLDTGWFCAGGMLAEGRLVAVCLAEKCGDTLVNHIEKALYSHAGAYPAIVQAFAARYGGGCAWVNREDDARDKGLRTSKLQYLPAALGGKVRLEVGTELDMLRRVPTLKTERLTLTALRPGDKEAYNALCLDDDRNRWWGYDFRKDYDGMIATDMPFHGLIVESCGNKYIQKCYKMLLPNLTMYQSSMIKFISNSSEDNPWSPSVIYNHVAVVEAIKMHIPDLAKQAMADHVKSSLNFTMFSGGGADPFSTVRKPKPGKK